MSRTFICPHCGVDVPYDAEACPECGSDEQTGWSRRPADEPLILYYDEEPSTFDSWIKADWMKKLLTVVSIITVAGLLISTVPGGLYLVVVLLVILGIYYGARQMLGTRHGERGRLYGVLLQKALGDESLVERLIEYERQRNPHLSRAEWIEYAIDRWERDLR